MQIKIIYGSPASGKSTYVKSHKSKNDLVIDLDLIKRALSMEHRGENSNCITSFALRVRQMIIDEVLIHIDELYFKNVWIVTTMTGEKLKEFVDKFDSNVELLFVECDKQTCLQRMFLDSSRPDKDLQKSIIEKWFLDFDENYNKKFYPNVVQNYINSEQW